MEVSRARKIIWLDLIRGICALLVCVGHMRSVLMVDLAEVQSQTLWVKFFYLVTGLGHQAVIVFFVLSGYLVGGSLLRSRHSFRFRDYFLSRVTRLWVVLVPALLLTCLADAATNAIVPGILAGSVHSTWGSTPAEGQYAGGWGVFFANLFFFQSIAAPVFGSNGPLWSLAYEFWYYVTFPLLLGLASDNEKRGLSMLVRRVLCASLFALLVYLSPRAVLVGFVIWIMGAGAAAVRGRVQERLTLLLLIVAVGAFCVSTVLARLNPASVWSDLSVGLTFSSLLVILLDWKAQPASGGVVELFGTKLSDFSYSLYATHFPIAILLGALLGAHVSQKYPNPMSFALLGASVAALCLIGWVVWWATERHTTRVKAWAIRLMGSTASAARPRFVEENK